MPIAARSAAMIPIILRRFRFARSFFTDATFFPFVSAALNSSAVENRYCGSIDIARIIAVLMFAGILLSIADGSKRVSFIFRFVDSSGFVPVMA